MQNLPPFSCHHSPVVSDILNETGCSILLSSFQTGKLILLSTGGEETITQLPRNFNSPMGVAVKDNKMALAVKDEVIIMKNSSIMAETYPLKPNCYDALFFPTATYYTGNLALHDLHFTSNKTLWAVNTSYSCLVKINDDWSFEPVWKPFFIDKLASEDRCHLNGMVFENDKPKYVTALSRTNTLNGWKENVDKGGVVIDVETNEIISNGLSIPHSPRIYNNNLYVLQSGKGELIKIDQATGNYEVVTKLNGFARGMDRIGDYIFIGISKLRENSSSFGKLSLDLSSNRCGFTIVHLPTGNVMGEFLYKNSVEEIYDLLILKNTTRPNILNTDKEIHKQGLITPEHTYWSKILQKEIK